MIHLAVHIWWYEFKETGGRNVWTIRKFDIAMAGCMWMNNPRFWFNLFENSGTNVTWSWYSSKRNNAKIQCPTIQLTIPDCCRNHSNAHQYPSITFPFLSVLESTEDEFGPGPNSPTTAICEDPTVPARPLDLKSIFKQPRKFTTNSGMASHSCLFFFAGTLFQFLILSSFAQWDLSSTRACHTGW